MSKNKAGKGISYFIFVNDDGIFCRVEIYGWEIFQILIEYKATKKKDMKIRR